MVRLVIAAALAGGLAACASNTGAVKSELVALGVGDNRAACLADEFNERLDRDDMNDVAAFLKRLNDTDSPGNVLDVLLTIDNPRAAAVAPVVGASCAIIPRRR
ncbi:MAG: hypothetical protein AAFR11_14475 [Pseudomonadota bacterium]